MEDLQHLTITPAYRRFRIAPLIVDGLIHATATIETPFESAKNASYLEGSTVKLEVMVPAGTVAEIYLGDDRNEEVGSGPYYFQWKHA